MIIGYGSDEDEDGGGGGGGGGGRSGWEDQVDKEAAKRWRLLLTMHCTDRRS